MAALVILNHKIKQKVNSSSIVLNTTIGRNIPVLLYTKLELD